MLSCCACGLLNFWPVLTDETNDHESLLSDWDKLILCSSWNQELFLKIFVWKLLYDERGRAWKLILESLCINNRKGWLKKTYKPNLVFQFLNLVMMPSKKLCIPLRNIHLILKSRHQESRNTLYIYCLMFVLNFVCFQGGKRQCSFGGRL